MTKLLFQRPREERERIWKQVKEDKAFRLLYFKNDLYAFALYYFGHNFITGVKDFHKLIYEYCVSPKNFLCVGMRESGKTAIVALIDVVHDIAYELEDFILFMWYDLDSATDKVLNVSNFLRSNKKFKADFGLLFDDGTGRWKDGIEDYNRQKTMRKFVSTKWVKVEWVSLKNMKRWKQLLDEEWSIIRPSKLIMDDIDIEESVRNKNIIEMNYKKIVSGVFNSVRGKIRVLGNIIAEDWVIIRLEKTFKDYWNMMRISLIENGEITWKERYVWTEDEAKKINEEKFQWREVVQSVEMLSIDKDAFNSDFLNIPKLVIWDPVFNTNNVMKLEVLEPCMVYDIRIDDRDVKLEIFYKDFKKNFYDYLYAWVDTASGQWWETDSTDVCFLDKNGDLYARVNSNILGFKHTQKLLSLLYKDYWFTFFENALCVERNYLWISLIDEIREKDKILFKKLYVPRAEWKKRAKYANDVWWATSQSSKEKMKEDLSSAINLKKMKLSHEEQKEFKWWVKAEKNGKIVYEPDRVTVQHDDRVIGRGLAFQMFLDVNPNFLDYEK